ncbi:MAG: hypothetical protein IJW37_09865 [Lachnospiraceae bacterium]|nr:hypothetical protein [Lachnospiraceae bacterium]
MRKNVLGMMLLGGVLLAGCSCEHAWQEATCTTPATCEVCGTTEGEALTHDFMVATCAQPEVCGRCGEERGERLPHEEQFIGECDRCHEIQNRDVVETILSKLEEANPGIMRRI